MTRSAVILTVLFASAATGLSQQNRKLTADDYAEIQQLYARYNIALDTGEPEDWASTFTPDGVFMNNSGHDGLLKFATDFKKRNAGRTRHWNTNLLITPTPEGASGTCYLFMFDISTRPATQAASGRYQDTLVKTASGWKFKARKVLPDPAPKPSTQQ